MQCLQHCLRIYEGPKAVNDDVEVVEENDDQDDESDENYIPRPCPKV